MLDSESKPHCSSLPLKKCRLFLRPPFRQQFESRQFFVSLRSKVPLQRQVPPFAPNRAFLPRSEGIPYFFLLAEEMLQPASLTPEHSSASSHSYKHPLPSSLSYPEDRFEKRQQALKSGLGAPKEFFQKNS